MAGCCPTEGRRNGQVHIFTPPQLCSVERVILHYFGSRAIFAPAAQGGRGASVILEEPVLAAKLSFR